VNAKGDRLLMKMKKRLLSILLSLVLVLGLMPGMSLTAYAATTTVTFSYGQNSKDGVTLSGFVWDDGDLDAFGTVTSTVGNIIKIEVNGGGANISGPGWSGRTWTGSSTSVSGSLVGGPYIANFSSMVVTIESVAVTGVTLDKTGTQTIIVKMVMWLPAFLGVIKIWNKH